jgi:hypothetical protein
MNDDFESMRKEAVVAKFKHFPEGKEESYKTPITRRISILVRKSNDD